VSGIHAGADGVLLHNGRRLWSGGGLPLGDAPLEALGVPAEKCWININRFGNTSSASMPITLDEANRAGRLKKGDVIAMMAIGAGMTWGGTVLRW
jgi:3-oxoacyl-[acyl-carrier-protein] synthase-3